MPPRDKDDRRCRRTRPRSSRSGSSRGPSSTPGSTRRPTSSRNCASAGSRRAPPAKYPYPTIVNALAFTPDGKQLVVGGHHELTVWDIATGKLLKRIYTRAERAYAMAFLPDGKLAVAGGRPGQEGDVRIYDLDGQGQDRRRRRDPRRRQRPEGDGQATPRLGRLGAVPRGRRRTARRSPAGGCDRAVRVWDYPAARKASWSRRSRTTPTGCSASRFAPGRQAPADLQPRQDGQGVGPGGQGIGADVPGASEHRLRRRR